MYTKGPWQTRPAQRGRKKFHTVTSVRDDGATYVADIFGPWGMEEISADNLRLIEAAPDLLEALEMLRDDYPAIWDIIKSQTKAGPKLKAAITKARGEE